MAKCVLIIQPYLDFKTEVFFYANMKIIGNEEKKQFIEFCEDNLWRKNQIIHLDENDLQLMPKVANHYKFAVQLYLTLKYGIVNINNDNFISILAKKEKLLHKHLSNSFFDISHHRTTEKEVWKTIFLKIKPELSNLFKVAKSTSHIFQQQLNNSNSEIKGKQLEIDFTVLPYWNVRC